MKSIINQMETQPMHDNIPARHWKSIDCILRQVLLGLVTVSFFLDILFREKKNNTSFATIVLSPSLSLSILKTISGTGQEPQ